MRRKQKGPAFNHHQSDCSLFSKYHNWASSSALSLSSLHQVVIQVQLCDPDLLPRADLDLQVAAKGEARRHPQPENPLRDGPWKAGICLLPGKLHFDYNHHLNQL